MASIKVFQGERRMVPRLQTRTRSDLASNCFAMLRYASLCFAVLRYASLCFAREPGRELWRLAITTSWEASKSKARGTMERRGSLRSFASVGSLPQASLQPQEECRRSRSFSRQAFYAFLHCEVQGIAISSLCCAVPRWTKMACLLWKRTARIRANAVGIQVGKDMYCSC